MNKDSESAARLSKAVQEIDGLLNPRTAPSATLTEHTPSAAPATSALKIDRFCKIVYFVAIFNWLAFLSGDAALGGDAVNGKVEGGRYYVYSHRNLREVSKAAFNYSRFHCYSLMITHPLAMICAFLSREKKRSKLTKRS